MSVATTIDGQALAKQLEELYLLKCSLLPKESVLFVLDGDEDKEWTGLLEAYPDDDHREVQAQAPHRPACLKLQVEGLSLWVEVVIPTEYGIAGAARLPSVSVRCDQWTRREQQQWRDTIDQLLSNELVTCENTIYELVSTHLFPLLQAEAARRTSNASTSHFPQERQHLAERYHALLTSHHLISPTKRRSLQSWSSELNISGFAKVGYPGVIYAEGDKDAIEDFVRRIKAMQWLALRVRFVEPLLLPLPPGSGDTSVSCSWSFFEKVGEVVEEMRRLGRETYAAEMGIGSAGSR